LVNVKSEEVGDEWRKEHWIRSGENRGHGWIEQGERTDESLRHLLCTLGTGGYTGQYLIVTSRESPFNPLSLAKRVGEVI